MLRYFCPQITLPLKSFHLRKSTSIKIRIQLTSRDILLVWWSVLDKHKLLYYFHTMWKAGKLVKGSSININADWLVTNRGLITKIMFLFIMYQQKFLNLQVLISFMKINILCCKDVTTPHVLDHRVPINS